MKISQLLLERITIENAGQFLSQHSVVYSFGYKPDEAPCKASVLIPKTAKLATITTGEQGASPTNALATQLIYEVCAVLQCPVPWNDLGTVDGCIKEIALYGYYVMFPPRSEQIEYGILLQKNRQNLTYGTSASWTIETLHEALCDILTMEMKSNGREIIV